VRIAVAALVAALLLPAAALADSPAPTVVRFETDYPSALFTASAPCNLVPNGTPDGSNHWLQALCQPTLRLTFARPQASVELLARAFPVLPVVPSLVATAHRTTGPSVTVTVADPGSFKPVVLASPVADIDYVELSAPGADLGIDDLALSEFSQPDTAIVSGPDLGTAATTAAFTFRTNRPDLDHYACSLDGLPFAPCAVLSGLALGPHTLRAAAVDGYGGIDPSPASYAWTVLPPAPQTRIDSVLYDEVTFSSPDPADGFECQVDGGPWVPCTSPHRFTGLALGTHVIAVRAIGKQKQWDLTPETRTLLIEKDTDGDGIPDRDDPLRPGNLRPTVGETGNAQLVGGEVTVTLPDGRTLPLKGVATLPIGTVVDTTKGAVTIHVASNGYAPGDRRYRDATVTLKEGIFRIRQARMRKGLTQVVQIPVEFVILTPPRAAAVCSSRAKGVVRRLTASGKGVFRVTGAATYGDGRSAAWTTTDRCDGTLTQVRRGHVKVHRGRRAVVVRQGHRYLARARLFRAKKGRAQG
jgi:hypothetical protein